VMTKTQKKPTSYKRREELHEQLYHCYSLSIVPPRSPWNGIRQLHTL